MPDVSEPSTSTTGPGLVDVVRRLGVASWSLLGLLLFLGAVIWILGRIQVLLAPVVLAVVIIYVLNPVVSRLEAAGIHRLLGSCFSYVLLLGLLVLLGWLIIPPISDQASEFADRFPEIYDDATVEAERLVANVGLDVSIPRYEELREFVTDPDTQDVFIAEALDRIRGVTLGLLGAVLVFFLAPVVAFYMLMDLPRLRDKATSLIPAVHEAEFVHVSRQLGKAIGGFLRGQVLVALIVGVLTSIGFLIIGLPFWLIIGMIAGILNIVPFVGPWVGGALGVFVGLFSGNVTTAVWAAVVAAAVQQIDNNFISPSVLRATVRVHPATVILALLAGGALAGVWGVLLAVPMVAAVKIVLGHFWRTRVLSQSWEEVTEALIEEPKPPEPLLARRRRSTGDAGGDGEDGEVGPEEEPFDGAGGDADAPA